MTQQSGIFLSQTALSSLSPATQDEIQRYLFGDTTFEAGPVTTPATSGTPEDDSETPPDMSVAQARKLIDGCSERPTAALRFIAEQPTTKFLYQDMVKAIGQDSSGTIRGTLAAITRRTRTVLGDSDAALIWYEGEHNAWTATVSEMTRSSLRKAFGIA
jgi:hypothetical protein